MELVLVVSMRGAANIGGNLNVGGVLTYEDVTNIDSVGIITARSGIRVGAGESLLVLLPQVSETVVYWW